MALLGPIVAACTLIFGALIQFGIFSFFMGKMKGVQDALSQQLTAVVGQLAGFQGAMQALQVHRSELDTRMEAVERNAAGIAQLKSRFDRHEGGYEVQSTDFRQRLEKLERGYDGINRQFSNLAGLRRGDTGLAGLHELRRPSSDEPSAG